MTDETELRQQVVAAARRGVAEGLNRGTAGNVSVRAGAGMLITPSGVPAQAMSPDDIVFVDADGRFEGPVKPSSEWRIHRDLYAAKPEIGAVVHAHPPYAVSLACLRMGIPPFHYMVAVAGGKDIPCARYATFGTQALSDAVLEALAQRRACLMANHGLVAVGPDVDRALDLALAVEELCAQYWRARLAGEPVLLTDAEMDEVLERFQHYGQR